MNHLNSSSVLVIVLEICLSSTGVLGGWPDVAMVVQKLVALGRSAEMPACATAAIGEDTKAYHQNTRVEVCERMNRNVVIDSVSEKMNHHPNTLSGEVPSDTKVFAVFEEGQTQAREGDIVGFHCKANTAAGSKSFVVVLLKYDPGEFGYVAYVPREYVRDDVANLG